MTEEATIVGSLPLGQHTKAVLFRYALNQQKTNWRCSKEKNKHALGINMFINGHEFISENRKKKMPQLKLNLVIFKLNLTIICNVSMKEYLISNCMEDTFIEFSNMHVTIVM